MKELGAQKESFDIIVASGVNGSMPHAKASDKVIEPGDFVTMDFGVRVGEYCSDITRTVAVERAGAQLRQVYETVKEAQAAAIRAIRPGKTCGDIDREARDVICLLYTSRFKRAGARTGAGEGQTALQGVRRIGPQTGRGRELRGLWNLRRPVPGEGDPGGCAEHHGPAGVHRLHALHQGLSHGCQKAGSRRPGGGGAEAGDDLQRAQGE